MLPKHKTRGNGQGTAYKRGNTWEAQVIVGYSDPKKEGGQPIPIKRRKGVSPQRKTPLRTVPFFCLADMKSQRLLRASLTTGPNTARTKCQRLESQNSAHTRSHGKDSHQSKTSGLMP